MRRGGIVYLDFAKGERRRWSIVGERGPEPFGYEHIGRTSAEIVGTVAINAIAKDAYTALADGVRKNVPA